MLALLFFSFVLVLAVLISDLAERSILSIAVVFLVAGFVSGPAVAGVVTPRFNDPLLRILTDAALFSVLFTDGMRLRLAELHAVWRLPGRALLLGFPLALAGMAVLARLLLPVTWVEAFLIGAVLSPTDPVLASAIVERRVVPKPLRRLLGVESGLNDGLALPLVILALGLLKDARPNVAAVITEVAAGLAIGAAIPWVGGRVLGFFGRSATREYQAFFALGVAGIIYSLARMTHANEYLAAYVAGITLASMQDGFADEFMRLGDALAELLKLGALFVFGAVIPPAITQVPAGAYWFALAALFAVRPLAMQIALWGSPLTQTDRLVAGWFGPRGFASVIYILLVARAPIAQSQLMFHVVALVIVASMIVHSSTDILAARLYARRKIVESP